MYVKNVQLRNFRNYSNESIEFNRNINIIHGFNAQGKTNIIESLFMLAFSKSYRTSNDRSLIKFGEEFAKINSKVEKESLSYNLELILNKKGKKVKVNNNEKKKLSDFIGYLNVVLFAPEDLEIVKGAPSVRRKFLNMEIGQIDRIYLHNISEYNKVLKQRNEYLKILTTNNSIDDSYLDIITDKLIEYAVYIYKKRNEIILTLNMYANEYYINISNGHKLEVIYDPGFELSNFDNDNIYDTLKTLYKNNISRELQYGKTLYGPHRDDIHFKVDSKDVKIYGSQGQQRLVTLSLKLAEINLIKNITSEYPILILDDVMSELDDERKSELIKVLTTDIQTFITTTTLDGLNKEYLDKASKFYIKEGKIHL